MSESATIPTPADLAPKPAEADAPVAEAKSESETVEFWKQKAREQEKRAKDNAQAAKRLAEIEESSKTAEEKAAARLAEAERLVVELEAKATRSEVAAKSGHPVDILSGPSDITPDALSEYADRLTAYIEERSSERLRRGNVAPAEGTTPPAVNDERAAFADYLTGRR